MLWKVLGLIINYADDALHCEKVGKREFYTQSKEGSFYNKRQLEPLANVLYAGNGKHFKRD